MELMAAGTTFSFPLYPDHDLTQQIKGQMGGCISLPRAVENGKRLVAP